MKKIIYFNRLIVKKLLEETGISLLRIDETKRYNIFQEALDLEFKVFD